MTQSWQESLRKKLGNKVIEDIEKLADYGKDYTEEKTSLPEAIVLVKNEQDICDTLEIARNHAVPITPVIANTNVGGLAIPHKGGISLDLQQMNRIIEVNRDEMYAIVEPGVTFGDLKTYMDENAPELTIAYPLAPPEVSIMANCLLDGLGNLSYMHGAMAEWIGGLEIILLDGQKLKTGACALSSYWFSRSPLPDLSGLFVSWQGTTGIVTKLAVQLWPAPPHRKRVFNFTYSMEDGFAILRDLTYKFIFADLGGITWPTAKMLLGVKKPIKRHPTEPEFLIYADITAFSQEELDAKYKIFSATLKHFRKKGMTIEGPMDIEDVVQLTPDFKKFADFPMTLDFLLEQGGLSWIGTYGPQSRWPESARRGEQIMVEHGLAPITVTRPMKGGHYGVLRFISIFDHDDQRQKDNVRIVNEKLLELCVETGFVPYKMPPWAWDRLKERMDPGYIQLLTKIKKMLDPDGLLNPGKLIF